MHEDDPFGGFDLEDDDAHEAPSRPAAKKRKPGAKSKAKSPTRKDQKVDKQSNIPKSEITSYPAYAFNFEESHRGPRRCSDCFYYITNAGLATENIYDIQEPEFYALVEKLNEFEESIGVNEVGEVIENAKRLDRRFSQQPRMRNYCGVDHDCGDYYIPEIKNFDGHCKDFLPGQRPYVCCSSCTKISRASTSKPYPSDYTMEMPSSFYDPDMGKSAFDSYQRIRSIESSQYEQALKEYQYQLQQDVSEAVMRDDFPSNSTIDECRAVYRACATVNRGGGCQHYEDESGGCGYDPVQMLRDHYDCEYNAPKIQSENNSSAAPPCLTCQHMRVPLKLDPFEATKANKLALMDMVNGYNREQQQLIREENQHLEGAGKYLGRNSPPVNTLWCAAYSTWNGDQPVDYAYCYRALHQGESAGSCEKYQRRKKTDDQK